MRGPLHSAQGAGAARMSSRPGRFGTCNRFHALRDHQHYVTESRTAPRHSYSGPLLARSFRWARRPPLPTEASARHQRELKKRAGSRCGALGGAAAARRVAARGPTHEGSRGPSHSAAAVLLHLGSDLSLLIHTAGSGLR